MMTDGHYRNSLTSIVKNCVIIIDTCSILEPGCGTFLQDMLPILKAENKSIIVPTACMSEVQKHQQNPNFNGTVNLNKVIQSLITLNNLHLIDFIGKQTDLTDNTATYADNVMLKEVPTVAITRNVLFITQDKILNLKLLLATRGFQPQFIAASIDNNSGQIAKRNIGELWEKILRDEKRISNSINSITNAEQHKLNEINSLKRDATLKKLMKQFPSIRSVNKRKSSKTSVRSVPSNEKFNISTKLSSVSGVMPVSYLPGEDDSVTATRGNNKENIKLIKHIATGGEGSVFATDKKGIVAKIYKRERITRNRFEKLKLMISKDIDCEGICFPISLICNSQNEFVGFTMSEAKGKTLQTCVFMPMLLQKEFPNWTKKDTVQLSITILEKIKYLHDRNVILGDINPQNILVVSPKEVYFVDTDSYQVEGFPCPVGTLTFTAPECQRKDYATFLRTKGNENFAIATLLFMVMLPGKAPYAMQGSENMIDSIISMDFAYPLGEQKNGLVPAGKWRFIWSHMSYSLKQVFYLTFSKESVTDENNNLIPSHNTEETRYSVDKWLDLFMRYHYELDGLGRGDPMSLSLFPTRFKKGRHQTIEKCAICGKEFIRNYDQDFTTCFDCSQEQYKLKREEQYRKERQRKDIVYRNITCAVCGKKFTFTNGEKEFYDDKGLDYPKRCKNCRQKGGKQQNSGSCYIATAVYGSYDCPEVLVLRRFRDECLRKTTCGKIFVYVYYALSPKFVKAFGDTRWFNGIFKYVLDKLVSILC